MGLQDQDEHMSLGGDGGMKQKRVTGSGIVGSG